VGNEHAVVSMLGSTAVVAYVSSNVHNANGPSAVKCSSVSLSATGQPTIVADQIQLTFSNSDRLGHTALACDPASGHCLLAYGANNIDSGNTQTYATVVDANCKDLSGGFQNHVRLSNDANQNQGAPYTLWDGKKFVFGYYTNNDAAYGMLVHIIADPNTPGQFLPEALTDPQRLTPSNIGRPSIVTISDSRALFAAPRGQQRPSEGGNEVRLLNTDTAAIVTDNNGNRKMPQLWKSILVQAKPDQNNIGGVDGLPGPLGGNGIYPGQPILAMGTGGVVYLSSVISNGGGRNRNKKGSSTAHLLSFAPTDTGPNVITQQTGLSAESSHVTLCSGMVGTSDAPVHQAIVYGAPITGFASSSLTFIQHDPMAKTLTQTAQAAVSAQQADSGYLSNMLGRNPAQQGREHLRCIGDVANPGYGVANGFMPKVKSFVVAPWGGRINMDPATAPKVNGLPEDRNALFLTFVAAVRDKDLPPPPPPAPSPNPDQPGTPGSPGSPGMAGSPGTPGTPGTPAGFAAGCSMGGETTSSTAALVFLSLALVALVARRRWS